MENIVANVMKQLRMLCIYSRKLREQQENERQAKLRLQRRLDALRPTASVSGRNDPAENIPTVFDMVIPFFCQNVYRRILVVDLLNSPWSTFCNHS